MKLIKEEILIKEVQSIREMHSKMGARKLYNKLESTINEHNIKIGRDALFDILRDNNLLVKRRKQRKITTNSKHWLRKYPNLIKDISPTAPNQIWVSDITYWKANGKHLYISFITDAYSHKIVGFHVADNMECAETAKALKMALKDIDVDQFLENKLIHHSDRGVQYCAKDYVNILRAYNIDISMTQSSDPLDNSIAERVNGIMKHEYLFSYAPENLQQAKNILDLCVNLYNNDRPHNSIGNKTPNEIHINKSQKIKRLWKSYYPTKNKKLIKIINNDYCELE
jgi:transposase InsO family protein